MVVHRLRIIACFAAAVLAGCGAGGATTAPFSPAQNGNTLDGLRPNRVYEFRIVNNDETKTLEVRKTHKSQCLDKGIPEMNLAPKASWGGIVDTNHAGLCALLYHKIEVIHLQYVTGKADDFIEAKYLWHNSNWWQDSKLGGLGTLTPYDWLAPIVTTCAEGADLAYIKCTVTQ